MKNKQIFIYIKELEELEKEQKWLEVITLLNSKINEGKDRKEYVIRLIAQYCFILTEWEFYDFKKELDYSDIKQRLVHLYESTIDEYKDDDKYSFIVGYYSLLFTFLFYPDGLDEETSDEKYSLISNQARKMRENIYQKNKDNVLYKYYHFDNNTPKEEYRKCEKELSLCINEYFPNNSEIELYFKEVCRPLD